MFTRWPDSWKKRTRRLARCTATTTFCHPIESGLCGETVAYVAVSGTEVTQIPLGSESLPVLPRCAPPSCSMKPVNGPSTWRTHHNQHSYASSCLYLENKHNHYYHHSHRAKSSSLCRSPFSRPVSGYTTTRIRFLLYMYNERFYLNMCMSSTLSLRNSLFSRDSPYCVCSFGL